MQRIQYRIDRDHSNSYTAWKRMGSPQSPTPEQYAELEARGQLESIGSPLWVRNNVTVPVDFSLPRQGVSLFEFAW